MTLDEVPPAVGDVAEVAGAQQHALRGRARKLRVAVEVDAVGGDGRQPELIVEVRVELVALQR